MGRSPGKRSTRRQALVGIFALLSALLLAPAQADSNVSSRAPSRVYIACAANFFHTMKQLTAAYQQHHSSIELLISSGSSGSLYRQITLGSPHQLFVSADSVYPKQLERDQLILPGSRKTYAIGELVLWHPGVKLNNLQQLSQQRITLAIANPKTAPYGKAAQQVLKTLSKDRPWKLVIGASIAQTHQFVDSGNAQAGFISRSLIRPGMQHITDISNAMHPPLTQQMVLTQKAKDNPHAKLFHQFLSSNRARDIIQANGYQLPDFEPSAAQVL